MRAYASDKFGDIADLRLQDLPDPVAGKGELLVQIHAAAINPAELKVLRHIGAGGFLHASVFPLLLGYDFSGVVTAHGADVPADAPAVGAEVYGFLPYARSTRGGTFAELVAVGATTVGPKPKSISHAEAAAAATSAVTALQALRDKARVASGQRVLINGASGGVGSYAIQIAKALGAHVSGNSSAAKMAHVTQLGADHAYDYKASPLASIEERFDMVFDVASNSSYGACAHLLNPGGTYVTLLPSFRFVTGVLRTLVSSRRCKMVLVKPIAADLAQISTWFDAKKLTSSVDATYPLAELPVALARQDKGDVRGKIAIAITGS